MDQKYILINHIHLEEDAGKLVHDDFNAVSLADYNRCGIPLVEIVTEPDISSAEEAKAFIEKVMLLLQYAGVSDCKMEEGSLRCDVNVSIQRPGDKELGTRAEIKNMNSLKSITRAINYEIKRQSRLLDAGKKVVQETRRFNENKGETSSMRSKENAHDYRYFPEPDILQVNFTDEMLDSIKNMLPELPYKRMERYMKDYGLSKTDAQILINQKSVSDFYDAAVSAYNAPKSIANFIIVELLRRVNLGEVSMTALPISAAEFAELVKMSDTEQVSKNDAKKILRQMIETGKDAKTIAEESGMLIVNDTKKAKEVIGKILADNTEAVAQYQSGEKKVFGFLMGQCTKSLRGVCTPGAIKNWWRRNWLRQKPSADEETKNAKTDAAEETREVDCTPFSNPNQYVPGRKDGVTQISTDHLLHEFDFSDAADHVGEEISLRACVHKIRQMSGFAFIILRTGRYLIQSLYVPEQCKDSITGLREGNFVWVRGKVTKNERQSAA